MKLDDLIGPTEDLTVNDLTFELVRKIGTVDSLVGHCLQFGRYEDMTREQVLVLTVAAMVASREDLLNHLSMLNVCRAFVVPGSGE